MTASPEDVSPALFREVLGRLASGVCVVTSREPDGTRRGLTATAVCSVSLDPPLVLVCLGRSTRTHDAIEASGVYALNLLSSADSRIAERFAADLEEKFGDLASGDGTTGAPLLEAGLGYCDCVVVDRLRAGDHTVFVGRVREAKSGRGADSGLPLLRYLGDYGTVSPEGSPGAPSAPGLPRDR